LALEANSTVRASVALRVADSGLAIGLASLWFAYAIRRLWTPLGRCRKSIGERALGANARCDVRQVVPAATVEITTSSLRARATPLLEEERYALARASVTQVAHPRAVNPTVAGARLASGYQPIDAVEAQSFEGAEKWFRAYKPYGGWDRAEDVCTMDEPAILNRDAHPHVWGPIEDVSKIPKSLVALGKDLESVPMSLAHGREDLVYEIDRNVLVKQV
jgi:hypothetical protein